MRPATTSVLGLLVLASASAAQPVQVSAERVLAPNEPPVLFLEPAVAASGADVAVIWQSSPNGPHGLGYAASADYGATFVQEANVIVAPGSSADYYADPMAAARWGSGEIWLGGLAFLDGVTKSPFARRKPPGTAWTSAATVVIQQGGNADKNLCALGPASYGQSPSDPTEAVYVAWAFGILTTSYATQLPNPSWGTPNPVSSAHPPVGPRAGVGPFPLVIPGGPERGLFLLGYSPGNMEPPFIGWSEANGGPDSWNFFRLNRYQSPSQVIFALDHSQFGEAWTYTSMAVQPTSPWTVVVAWPGRVSSTDPNVDIFVAYSTDGGRTFGVNPQENPFQQVFRFSDGQMRMPDDPPGQTTHDYFCSIAMAENGSVHLLFVQSWIGHVDKNSVCYAFWPSVNHLGSAPTYTRRFSAQSDAVYGNGAETANHYHMITSDRGCLLHAAYVTHQGVAHRVVNTCLAADSNFDAGLNPSDVTLFSSHFSTGHPRADLNGDGQVSAADAERFLTSYACGCNP